jgi:hypothetical protein
LKRTKGEKGLEPAEGINEALPAMERARASYSNKGVAKSLESEIDLPGRIILLEQELKDLQRCSSKREVLIGNGEVG